jgi:hypothetical protein
MDIGELVEAAAPKTWGGGGRMSEQSQTRKKFIMGWLTARPGKRDEFMAISQAGRGISNKHAGSYDEKCGADLQQNGGVPALIGGILDLSALLPRGPGGPLLGRQDHRLQLVV